MGDLKFLPNAKATPENFIRQLLESADELRGVIVVLDWKDGSMTCGWTNMSVGTTAAATLALQHSVTEALHGRGVEED
jgi:hypothetical protein